MLCVRCSGNGKYMGLGFMMRDCELCTDIYGSSFKKKAPALASDSAPALDKINRKSKSYKTAITDIMVSNDGITREEAVKMFDEAYNKNP